MKKNLLLVVSSILLVVCSFLGGALVVSASETAKFTESFIGQYHYVDTKGKYGDFQHFTRVSDGMIAYCIEPGVPPTSSSYEGFSDLSLEEMALKVGLSSETLEKVSLIAYFGYGYQDHLSDEWIVATQSLIWQETGRSFSFTSKNNREDPDKYKISTPKTIKSKMEEITSLVNDFIKKPILPTEEVKLWQGESHYFQDSALKNYQIKNKVNCTASLNGDNLFFTTEGNESGKIVLERKYTAWNGSFIVYHHQTGQDMIVPGKGIMDEIEYNYTLVKGKVIINKKDGNTKSCTPELKDTVYRLYDAYTEEYKTDIYVNENCQAIFGYIFQKGKYYIQEYKARPGYKLDDTKYYFDINDEITEVSFDLENQRLLGQIKITKLDKDSKTCQSPNHTSLTNAVYGIYKTTGELVDQLITNDNCEALSLRNLEMGDYYLEEITAPLGYQKDLEKHYFSITLDNVEDIIEIPLQDEVIKTELIINKTYLVNNELKPEIGAVFAIYDEITNNLVATLTIDESAQANVVLTYGTYILKQVSGQPGYEKSKDLRIIVDENTKIKTYITLLNQEFKVRLKVKKVDELGNLLNIPNIKFKIYDLINEKYVCQKITYPEVKEICEFSTLENGTFITPMGLKPSKYLLEEVSDTNPGYIWNKDGLEFEINPDLSYQTDPDLGLILELDFVNEKMNGKLEFYKLDKETKKPLSGAIIDIFREDGSLYKSLTTDENGRIYLEDLEYGKYYLEEHLAPNGYTLYEEKMWFEIVNNDVIELIMEDEIIDIPNTYLNEIDYFSIFNIITILGLIIYEKKYC